jgi:dolichyl-phosphate-mannose-protein mannosyltransferase
VSTGVDERDHIGLSRTAHGHAVPLAAQRVDVGKRFDDPFWGWASAVLVAALALFLRLWRLGRPEAFSFDETYYANDAWSLLHFGYVREYVEGADDKILDGTTTGLWGDDPSMIVHPEVGKWLIALGEKAFGMDAFGWRISAAVAGTLMVLVMCRLARRLTGSTALGCIAGLLLCFDGLHLVLSRLALLDIFMALFLLCGVHCIVADRQAFRARLAATVDPHPDWGPVRSALVRPWLIAAGVSFGLAIGTKWTALVPLAVFGILVWLWSAGARRSFGVKGAWWKSAIVDGLPAFGQLVVVAAVVYGATWTGWLMNVGEYERALSNSQYTTYAGGEQWPTATEPDAQGLAEVSQSLRSLAHYHRDAWVFHTHFLNDSTHTYGSKPRGWLLLSRPVGVDAQLGIKPGEQGCDAPAGSDCLRQVLLIGTPLLWWAGAIALLYAVGQWWGARDWRFGLCVIGAAATWLPWFRYDDRPIFIFYAIATLPFTILAITLAIGKLIGPSKQPSPRRTVGVILAGSFLVLVLVNFAWFWPIWTDVLLTHDEWAGRMWFRRWI